MAGTGSSTNRVFNIKIYLDDVYTQDTTIGLYTSGGQSYFNWQMSDTLLNSKSEFIYNMGKISQSADFRRGGGVAQNKGTSIQISNIASDGIQFWKKLESVTISLEGLKAEIIETGAETKTIFTGICGTPEWDTTRYNIPIVHADYKRRINISTQIDNNPVGGNYENAPEKNVGEIIPITFGDVRKAKFLRTAEKITPFELTTASVNIFDDYWVHADEDIKVFPVVGNDGATPPIMYKIKLANNVYWYQNGVLLTSGVLPLDNLAGNYIKVVEGDGNGLYRSISVAEVDIEENPTIIEVTLNDYMVDTLAGNGDATAENNSWVTIENIERKYRCDDWPCKNFVDSNGSTSTQGLELYSYVDEKKVTISELEKETIVKENDKSFVRLPQYAYKESTTSEKNEIEIDVKLFEKEPDKMNSFLILPCENIREESVDYQNWILPVIQYEKVVNGIYRVVLSDDGNYTNVTHLNNIDNIIDKKYSTYGEQELYCTVNDGKSADYIKIILFDFPPYPYNFTFDELYIGLTDETTVYIYEGDEIGSSARTYIYLKRFIGSSWNISGSEFATINQITTNSDDYAIIDDHPDFYFTDDVNTNNKNFYYSKSVAKLLSGYNNFATIKCNNIDMYNAVKSGALIYLRNVTPHSGALKFVDRTRLHELSVIFKKEISIKDEIYSGVIGRIYDSEWNFRKNSNNVIAEPIDVIEHILRLQNWSEIGSNVNYGKEYTYNALINIANEEGGFEFDGIDIIRDSYNSARQILNYDEAWSDVLINDLCKQYWLCSFKNSNGYECINYIGKVYYELDVSIGLDDIIKGSISSVEIMSEEDIFCEPYVKYNYNYATDKFDSMIKISRSNADAFDQSYVSGYSGLEAENIWYKANALWKYCKKVEEPPKELTECKWIRTATEAKKYLDTWLEAMGAYKNDSGNYIARPPKRISFKIPYDLSMTIGEERKAWFVSMHFNLMLPHQTDNESIQCIIEEIEFDPMNGETYIKAIMLGITDEISLYIKDTYNSYESIGLADWKDSYQTQSEAPSQGYDIEDIY